MMSWITEFFIKDSMNGLMKGFDFFSSSLKCKCRIIVSPLSWFTQLSWNRTQIFYGGAAGHELLLVLEESLFGGTNSISFLDKALEFLDEGSLPAVWSRKRKSRCTLLCEWCRWSSRSLLRGPFSCQCSLAMPFLSPFFPFNLSLIKNSCFILNLINFPAMSGIFRFIRSPVCSLQHFTSYEFPVSMVHAI